MSNHISIKPGGLLFAMVLGLGLAPSTWAATTAVGTVVSNTASAAFNVNGTAQTPKTGSTSFTVDRKIDLTLVDANTAYNSTQTPSPAPGSSNAVLKYTLANTGNGTQDYHVTAADTTDPYGGTDNYDQSITVFVDNTSGGGTVGTYDPGIDTATFVDELAAGSSISVFLVGNIALARLDGDISAKNLTAQAEIGGTAASEGAAVVQLVVADTQTQVSGSEDVVFADGIGDGGDATRDGQIKRKDAFKVVSAQITVTKSSEVISDPFNLLVNPKRIPGATVRYYITVANSATAGAAATAFLLSDDIASTTTLVVGSLWRDNDLDGVCQEVGETNYTDADDNDGGDQLDADTVEFDNFNLAANTSRRYCFDVTIN